MGLALRAHYRRLTFVKCLTLPQVKELAARAALRAGDLPAAEHLAVGLVAARHVPAWWVDGCQLAAGLDERLHATAASKID